VTNCSAALPLVMVGAMFFVPSAHAQGRGAFASAPAGRTATTRSGRRGVGTSFVRMHRSRQFFADYSGFAPYYSDYDSAPEIGQALPPQPVGPTVQPLPPAPPVSSAGLVLELQGDHWVRLTNYGELQTGEQSSQSEPERASNAPPPRPPVIPAELKQQLNRRPARFHPQFSCFATGTRKKSENI
jgi:hypothetical protein